VPAFAKSQSLQRHSHPTSSVFPFCITSETIWVMVLRMSLAWRHAIVAVGVRVANLVPELQLFPQRKDSKKDEVVVGVAL